MADTKKTMGPVAPIPGQKYVVQAGDTLTKIAKKAYGNAAKWPIIYNANATTIRSGNPDIIRIGDVFNIPKDVSTGLEAKEEAEIVSALLSGRPKGSYTVVIDGKEIPVLSGELMVGIDLLCASWTADIAWTPGKDPELDKRVKRYSYAKSELYLGQSLAASGRLYGVEPHVTASGITKALEFFTSTADLVDTTMAPPYEFTSIKLKAFASELCAYLGYAVVVSSDYKEGAAFDSVSIGASETLGNFIQRLAYQRGNLATCDEYGRVVLCKAKINGNPVDTLEEGKGIAMEFHAKFDGRERFSVYKARGQSGDADSQVYSKAIDPAVPISRQLTFTVGDTNSANIQATAEWKRSKALADSLSIPIPVSDWYDSRGNLWKPNTIVLIKSPALDISDYEKFLIRSVRYSFKESGRSAILNIVPPSTLAGSNLEEAWA